MQSVVAKIAESSPFLPATTPYHVPIFGALHSYSKEAVFAALGTMPGGDIVARFVRFESKISELRVVVELCDDAAALLGHLQQALPEGKVCAHFYVTLGSMHAIDAARHGEFVSAVSTAFPIDPNTTFRISNLELREAPDPDHVEISITEKRSTKNVKKSVEKMDVSRSGKALNPAAKPFVPNRAAPDVPASHRLKSGKKKRRKKPFESPHLKWERAATELSTGRSSIDELIRHASTTGSTGGRIAKGARDGVTRGAGAIAKARRGERQVWVRGD